MRKIFEGRFYPLVLYLGYLLLMGIAVYLIDHNTKAEITEALKKWIPWNLKLNFLLILIGVGICLKEITRAFKALLNRKGIYLLVLLLLAYLSVSFAAPRTHRIFFDEDIYANIGQNIALTGQTGMTNYGTFDYGEYTPHWVSYNKEPSGWPFLISLLFQVFGTNELYAFLLNNLLFTAGLLVVFFITRSISEDDFTSFLSALAFGLIPHNLIWSNTAAAEPPASFFAGLAVLSLVVYLKKRGDRHLFMTAVLLPFACQMRPESILILFLALMSLVFLLRKEFCDRKIWAFGLLVALFLLPHLLHIYAVSGHDWGAKGAKFSFDFFWKNLSTNGLYYWNNEQFPLILTLFSCAGLLIGRRTLSRRLPIFLWFLLFWGIFLFFYAGSYRYGADVRFALVSFMPLAVLAGIGGGVLRERILNAGPVMRGTGSGIRHLVSGIIILVMLFSFIQFLPLVRRVGQEAWGARHDHEFAKTLIGEIPRRSIILTQVPTMFLVRGQSAIQTHAGTNNPKLIKHLLEKYQGHVYFHYNYWCNTKSERNLRLCREIREKYDLTEVVRTTEQDHEYGLYRMEIRK